MADEKIETPALASSDSESNRFAAHDAKIPTIVDEKNALPETGSLGTDRDLDGNPFSDPDVAAYWISVYEKSHYECRHVVDPKLEWSATEERKLVRKLDWHVCLWAVSLLTLLKVDLTDWIQCTMFFALQVDRGNLSQAVSDNLLDQLHLTTNGMTFYLRAKNALR
jgi:hypothetical protein